jgi:hypothetical protein
LMHFIRDACFCALRDKFHDYLKRFWFHFSSDPRSTHPQICSG